jgi:hypothetical protein
MRRRIKSQSTPVLRKAAASGASAARKAFPAWEDAAEGLVGWSTVTPRVRDGLILRPVRCGRSAGGRALIDGPAGR